MGDSEAVLTETSDATVLYGSTGYTDGAQEGSGVTGVVSREGDAVMMDMNSVAQGSYANETHEAKAVSDSSIVGQDTVNLQSSASGYDSFTNGSIVNQVVNAPSAENGIASHDVGGSAAAQTIEDGSVPPISAEEDRLWSIVRANSLDFDAWVALIEETERTAEGNILKIQRVYDAFLVEFPLCYGYWKKYADHEAHNSAEKAVEVYERAVQAVTYSVDIWLHYCRFAKSKYEDPDVIRRLFERGLAYVGTDYLSFTFWDEYVEYEYKQQEWGRIAMIYTKIFENPILYLDKYYNGFKELAANRPLSELRCVEEGAATATLVPDNVGQVDGREVPPNADDQSSKPVSAGLTEAEELEKYVAIREEMYKKAKEFDSKIVGFETAIARPYFHVKPLNVAELENWHNYLNFMESEDDFSKVVKLYERCLIACANYPEYWIRYIKCMEARGSMDLAENALCRATQVFVKRQPEIHLFAAWFKEHNGDVLGARAAYQLVHTEVAPGLLEAIIKHANMERRLGNLDDALSVYEQAIAIEKGKEQSQTLPVLFAQYSRFLHLVPGKAEKAREVFVEAPESVHCSKPFLETLICIETMSPLPKRIEYLDALVERFIGSSSDAPSSASIVEKEELSSIYLEFLDLVGDATVVKKAHDRHLKFFLHKRSSSSLSKKRHAEEFLSSDKSKLAKSDPTVPVSAQSLMGAYPGAQNQWTAGYGVQPQAWPQAAQAPVQQYPGYTQPTAAAYSGYGAGYPPPQVPASVPQSAAYATYSSAYPVQTAPQQTYAQPVAAVAPSQQASAVPQAYYGSYY